jgi:protoheme IX farnesyltransferase
VKSAAVAAATEQAPALARPRLADYVQLTRPRIGLMALFTVAVGYFLAAGPGGSALVLLHTLLGTGIVASGASALNQWLERKSDAKMRRTANRPLPAGRLHPREALAFGLVLGVAGVAYLALALPSPAAAVVAAITLVTYVGVYTPLKPVTAWNTVVGAFPGALPPVIGWCAAAGGLTPGAVALFAILFVWQLPHFYAIAWLYRDDYAAGGLRMLPAVDPDGSLTSRAMIGTCLLLMLATALPALLGLCGALYLAGALLLGVLFLNCALQFRRDPSRANAKYVLRASLLYLTGIMLLVLYDGVLTH